MSLLALLPTSKKVAGIPSSLSSLISSGVVADGPSSKVSAAYFFVPPQKSGNFDLRMRLTAAVCSAGEM
jgi:hypothetical protein